MLSYIPNFENTMIKKRPLYKAMMQTSLKYPMPFCPFSTGLANRHDQSMLARKDERTIELILFDLKYQDFCMRPQTKER